MYRDQRSFEELSSDPFTSELPVLLPESSELSLSEPESSELPFSPLLPELSVSGPPQELELSEPESHELESSSG